MTRRKRISTYLLLTLGTSFFALALVVVSAVNYSMRQQALAEAESKSRLMLDRNMAIHNFYTHELKPSLFQTIGPLKGSDYFDPNWMSSTYAVRHIDKYFKHYNDEPFYYRECAVSARSPENEADDYERKFLEDLKKDPDLTQRVAIRTVDQQPFFTVLRRGETMLESCLRCHSTPAKAPGDLVRRYGPERSFHRNIGDPVQAVSMRIPLSAAYGNANELSLKLSGVLIAFLAGTFGILLVVMQRLVISPTAQVSEKATLNASNPSGLGETIEPPKARELSILVEAFNDMSLRLKQSYDDLELKVRKRTADLQRANETLQKEVQLWKEAEEELRTTLYSIGDAVIATDTAGLVRRMNVLEEQLPGWTEAEAHGKPLNEVFRILKENTRETIKSPVDQVLEKGIVVGLGNHTLLIDRSGTERPIADSASPIRGAEGRIVGVVLVFRDETQRRAAQKTIQESEERYRAVFDSVGVGVDLVDPDGKFLQVNQALCEMLGYSDEELKNLTVMEVTHPDDLEISRSKLQAVIAGEMNSYRIEKRYIRKDGSVVWADLSVSAIRDTAGEHFATVGVMADITDRKKLEAQLLQAQKMEALGTLAGGIAHDFNNILQVVCGYSEILLAHKKQDDPERESLEKMRTAGERGAELVKNLMTFSRKVEPKPRPLDINHEIVEFQRLLSRTIPKTISIDLRLGGDVTPIMADPSQIGQILMNLGVNSRDAMPDGGTLVISTTRAVLDRQYCAAHPETQPGLYVLLSVSDTGTGMDKATVDRIFDPFFTTKEKGKGTGLGLSIVYGIVKQHQGHITCYSEPGIGTTFRIYFPLADSESRDESWKEEVPIQGGTETILLVDDEEIVRDIALKMLTEFGYTVITACDGKDALARYEESKERISLIILDLIMPEMDGKACLKEILRLAPEAKVLIASGYSDAETLTNIKTLGAKEFVEKPFNTRSLLQTVREVLDGA